MTTDGPKPVLSLRARTKNRIELAFKRSLAKEDLRACLLCALLAMVCPIVAIVVGIIYFPRLVGFCVLGMVGFYSYLACAGVFNDNLGVLALELAKVYLKLVGPVFIVAVINVLICASKPTVSRWSGYLTNDSAGVD